MTVDVRSYSTPKAPLSFFFFESIDVRLENRTPCGTSSMYRMSAVMCVRFVARLIPPITGLLLHNVYYGANDERGDSTP